VRGNTLKYHALQLSTMSGAFWVLAIAGGFAVVVFLVELGHRCARRAGEFTQSWSNG